MNGSASVYRWVYTEPEPVEKSPYCCPVCKGRGAVREGFYSYGADNLHTQSGTRLLFVVCRTCNGQGAIWG